MSDRHYKTFKEIMGNCGYRVEIAVGLDHCNYNNDDCQENYCPALGKDPRRLSNHPHYYPQPYLAQCPICSSMAPPDKIDWRSAQRYGALSHAFAGICGAALSGVALYYMGYLVIP
jgi:hypothetical protein